MLLDFDTDPHFVVFGDNECGKSNLLRVIADSLVQRYTPDEARLIFLDYRRALLDAAETEHRIGYAASSTAATQLVKDVHGALMKRLPPSDLTPEQLRNRSWWSGSDLFVFVDDYELVATPSGNPLMPLAELIPQARDIGLHIIVSRSMGGAGRSLFDPIVQRLKDMASPSLMMSGNKDEGALFGDVRPSPLPPGPRHPRRPPYGQAAHPDRPTRHLTDREYGPPDEPRLDRGRFHWLSNGACRFGGALSGGRRIGE